MVILALGALALLGLQLRSLSEAQTGSYRMQAVKLIEDLAERVKTNPGTYIDRANYVVAWGVTPPAPVNCGAASCTPLQLAAWDVNRWKQSVTNYMPSGDATVFTLASDPSQLGVVIAWRANEKSTAADYLAIQNLGQAIPVACPAQKICHLVFIRR